MIAIIAVGVSLSYSILRFANFAHIQYAVVGGYASSICLSASQTAATMPAMMHSAYARIGMGPRCQTP